MKKVSLYFCLIICFYSCDLVFIENISDANIEALAPLNNVLLPEGEIGFSWQPLEDANEYNFQLATPNFNETTAIVIDSLITDTSFSIILDSGNYEWRVNGINDEYETEYTSNSFILEYDLSSEEQDLIAPINDVQLTSGDISFSWLATEGAKEYQLQIATPNFTTPIEIVIDDLLTTNSFTTNLKAGEYEWRIKAINDEFETEFTSNSFILEYDLTSEELELTAPINDVQLTSGEITFSWLEIEEAIEYQLQIATPNFEVGNEIIIDTSLTTNSFTTNLETGEYQWRVKAINELSESEYVLQSLKIN